jgi:hypothetical protein
MKEFTADEAATLLGAQIAALARFRHVVEAQRAVLRMEDAGLLEVFTAEADGIFADISAREVQLMSMRAACQHANASAERDTRLDEHPAALDRERSRAATAAQHLVGQMQGEAGRVATEIKSASEQLDTLLRGYGRNWSSPTRSMIDRRG